MDCSRAHCSLLPHTIPNNTVQPLLKLPQRDRFPPYRHPASPEKALTFCSLRAGQPAASTFCIWRFQHSTLLTRCIV